MPSFAFITEGITDQIALEAILTGHYNDNDLVFNCLQPLRDETDSSNQNGFAGWELALEYCTKNEHLAEALAFNDYLIIQIDTDCGEHPNFGVPMTSEGVDKSVEQLVAEAKAVIEARLGASFVEIYGERVFFAICVHSLECWLLPLYERRGADNFRTKSCQRHLSRALSKGGLPYAKDADCYYKLVSDYARAKVLAQLRSKDVSLEIFLHSLPELTPKT